MNICRLPFLLCGLVTLIGGFCAGIGDWGVAAVYGVGFAAIVVYFTTDFWLESRQ